MHAGFRIHLCVAQRKVEWNETRNSVFRQVPYSICVSGYPIGTVEVFGSPFFPMAKTQVCDEESNPPKFQPWLVLTNAW